MMEKSISRRTLLKALIAGCGIAAASSLPRKWVKPVINAGLLPVHAQNSGTGTIKGKISSNGNPMSDMTVNAYTTELVFGPAGSTMKLAKPAQKTDPTPYASDISDNNGDYTITGLPAGSYWLYVHLPFEDIPYDPNPVVLSTGETKTADFSEMPS